MQKKKSLIWGICAVLVLGLAVSTSAGKQEKVQATSKPSVASFLKKVKSANKKVETVHFEMDLSLKVNQDSKSQDMEADLDYGTSASDLKRASAVIEQTKNGSRSYQEYILAGGQGYPIYTRTSEDGTWTKQTTNGDYYVQPGYFSFLNILYKMKDDLKLKETSKTYTLVLKSQNVDLVSLFKDELNLVLTGVSQTDVDKTFTVTFNKKTLYLSAFTMNLDYKKGSDVLKMAIDTSYSQWNKVDSSRFLAPDQTTT